MTLPLEWRIYGRINDALKAGDIGGALRQIDETRADTARIGAEIAGFEAECHRRLGFAGKALAILQAALEVHPQSYWLHHNIASLYREAGRKADCAREYRTAHALLGWTESEANRYIFLHDYFSPVIPCWTKWFGEMIVAEPIAALEIGSWQGGSATWLLDKIVAKRGGRLTCVDTFEGSSEHASWIGGIGDRIGDLFDANIAASGHAALCRKLVGRSQDVLRTLHHERFDFIYIDGAHEARYVIEDAVLAFGLLKDGGHICFDDYDFQFAGNPGQNTARAIDMFLDLYQDEISFVEKGRQVLLRKHNKIADRPVLMMEPEEPRAEPATNHPASAPPAERCPPAPKPLAAVKDFIAGRDAGTVLNAIFHRENAAKDTMLDTLAGLLPVEQIALTQCVDALGASDLEAAVLLLAALRKIRTDDSWLHYNLCKYLDAMVGAGVTAAKLPAIIHSFLALEGLKDDMRTASPLPLGVLARELPAFAPALERA